MIKVEVFSSPGCGKCAQAKAVLKAITEELGADKVNWRDINILDEIDYAVALGVMSSPAIAIDGKLVFSSLPSTEKLRLELAERLTRRQPSSFRPRAA